jgi:nucleotide-binding universal stress UspA family protein
MKRFKNLLLIQPVREREQSQLTALQRAVRLAKQNQAQLTVVDVLEELPNSLKNHNQHYQALLLDACKKQLEELVGPFREQGVTIETEVLTGQPTLAIVQKVLGAQIDMVIKDIQPADADKQFTGIDMQLMRKCPVPLWIIRPGCQAEFKHILMALNPELDHGEGDALSALIIELSTSLARMDKAALSVIHAWRLKGETELRRSAFVRLPTAEVDRLVEEERRHHESNLNAFLSQYDLADIQPEIELIKGPASEVLPRVAAQKEVDLLVMGTIGRSGLQGLIMGNTAENVLKEVTCSVLTLKPKGFKSPIA